MKPHKSSKNKKSHCRRTNQNATSSKTSLQVPENRENVHAARELHPTQTHALVAKDSEWISARYPGSAHCSSSNPCDDRVFHHCENANELPFAIMFPGIADKDPQVLQGLVAKTMSTTEITRRLVNLDEKADLTRGKPMEPIIPKDRLRLDDLEEISEEDNSLLQIADSSCTMLSEECLRELYKENQPE